MSAGPYATYTAEEDAAIRAALAAGRSYRALTAELGRSRSGVMAAAVRLDRPPVLPRQPGKSGPRHYRLWTAAEDAYLLAWWGIKPDAELARHLARTAQGCRGRAARLDVPRRANSVTLSDVAGIFGLRKNAVQHWVRQGWLAATRRPVRRGRGWLWHVPAAALERFVRQHGHPYDLARMRPDHWLTALAREHLAGDWLTLREAATVAHYGPEWLWRWVQAGELPARPGPGAPRLGKDAPTMVRRADLLAAVAGHEAVVRERMREAAARAAVTRGAVLAATA